MQQQSLTIITNKQTNKIMNRISQCWNENKFVITYIKKQNEKNKKSKCIL